MAAVDLADTPAVTSTGKPRATRPDGSFYSRDPRERWQQLVEDGKVGAKGSDLAKEHGKLGGRPRNVSAQEFVRQKAQEDAERIYAGLSAGLDSKNSKEQRDSAKAILDYEDKALKAEERKNQAREGMDKDAIIGLLVEKLTGGGPAAKLLKERLESVKVVDGSVTEDAQLPSGS